MCASIFPDHPEGRRPLALDEYGLKNRRCVEERDAASQGEMARRLEAMGYELEYNDWNRARGGRVSWRIKGIDESACAHYSTNHTRALQIARRWEAEYGRPITDAELTDQLRITRRAKSPEDKAQDLRPHWDRYRADLDAHGLAAPAPIRRDHPTGWATKPLAKRLGALEERVYSPQGLCRDGAVFSTAEIAPAVQRAAVGLHLTQDEIRQYEVGLRQELVPVREAADPAYSYWTTTAILMAEESIAQTIDAKAASRAIHIARETVERAIASQPIDLDPEQRQAVLDITKGSLWTFVEAPAGGGKTTLMRTVVDAFREERNLDRVVVVSTAAATAERSGQFGGATCPAVARVAGCLVARESAAGWGSGGRVPARGGCR
ncbi:MAG: AAA family ATPase [Solirubrobacteraceae bacterium]